MTPLASPSLSLSDVILALRGQVGAWAVRGWVSTLLGLLLHRRLGEIMGRMERLVGRFQAGRLWRIGAARRDHWLAPKAPKLFPAWFLPEQSRMFENHILSSTGESRPLRLVHR